MHLTIVSKKILYQNIENIKNYNAFKVSDGSISSIFRYGRNLAFIYYTKKEKANFIYSNYQGKLNENNINIISKNNSPLIIENNLILSFSNNNYIVAK